MNNNYNSLCDSMDTSRKRTWQTKIAALLFFVMFSVFGVNAQVTTNGGSGLAGTYGSLSAAVTALNAATITAPVVITLSGNETAPVGGYNITATGTSTNTITIQGSSSTITAATGLTSGTLTDAIFKITGGDWITIQNFTMQENVANTTTTLASNNMTEFGVVLFYATATNGAQNCTVQNNTISLNRTYANTFGVYSNSTHTASAVTTSASATGTGGGNSGLKVYGNTISNVNMGIVVIGPTAVADANTGIDIGGASSGTGNTISNFGTTNVISSYANVSGTVNGILVRNSNGFNIAYNSITSSNGGVTAGTLNGIQVPAASATPTATFTNTISNNTISLTSGNITGAVNGITYPSGSASTTSVLNVNNNNFTAAGYSATASGTVILISVASTNLTTSISSNTFTNIVSNTTGSFTFISNNFTRPANGTSTVNSNSIVTAFNKTGAGGTVTFYNSNSSSPTTATETNTGNNFSNVTVTGATTIAGWVSTDGSTTSPFGPNKTVTNNTFNNITGGTSAVTVLSVGYSNNASTTNNVSGNTVSNVTAAAAITGITSANGAQNFFGNTIFALSSTGASAVTGLNIGSASTANIYQNKIYNLSGNNASTTINGIVIAGGTTVNTYNNIIGDLRATAASGTDVIRGISITSATATSNQRVYYNTIYLNGTSSGTNFGSTGIFHTYSSTATTAALDMRNNIIVNASAANGTGLAVAFRRSAATDLLNYATTSNNNLFFGTSGVYNNGTTTYAFGPFQTLVSTRETASKSQNVTFANTATGSLSTYLNFASGAISLAGGNAQVISGYTTDYSGAPRDGSAPDMGAFEFAQGTITAPAITGFTTPFSPSAPIYLCEAGGSVVTITGTGFDTASAVYFHGSLDGEGVNTLAGTITGSTATTLTVTSPAGAVDGTITVVNPGGSVASSSTYQQALTPTVGVSAAATICSGSSTTLTATGANTYTWSPSLGLNGTTTASVVANPTATTTYTVTGTSTAGCTATNTVTVTVNPTPSAVSVSKTPSVLCIGGITTLTATGGVATSTLLSENFNSGVGTFTTTAASSTSNQNWAPQANGYVYSSTTHSGSVGGFVMANSDIGGSGSTANTRLISPSFSTLNATNLVLNFKEYLNNANDVAAVEISSDDFATVTVLRNQITTDIGSATAFASTSLPIPAAFNNLASVKIRFRFEGTWDYWWAVDEVTVTGSNQNLVWSNPNSDLYSNAGATTAYANENITTVYSKPASTSGTTYTVSATFGSCAVTTSVTVTPNALPTISTNGSSSICAGGTGASLSATGGVSYLWSPATGLSFADVASPTATPSTTTLYTVTGTDANGCKNTATATVTVNTPVAITTQPANQTAVENASASFSVVATGSGLTYQWQTYNGSTWDNISGETAATYSIASAPSTLNGSQYRVIVSGTAPCTAVTSSVVNLLVGSVAITTQPANQTICSNNSATYSIVTSGTVTSYQWQYSTNGVNWFDLDGQSTDTLVLSGLTTANTGTLVRCSVNAGALYSNTASLTVYNAITIDSQPISQTVCSNAASVTFSSAASGSGVAYLWEVSTNGGSTWSAISGATAATYTINTPGVGLNNNQYRVVVSGTAPCAAVTSNAVTLTVNQLVAITTQPATINQCATLPTATFSVVATGTGLTYQWQFSTNGTTYNDLSGETAASLVLSSPATYSGNSFRCVVSGAAPCTSVTSSAATLSLSQPLGGTYTVGASGNYATLTAAVAAYNAAICFTGPVVFNLTDTTYSTSETFPITINANANAGTNTLTIKPNTTATITGSVASAIIKLNGADYVIIDGSNNGGTDKSLTFENTNTSTASVAVWIASASASNGATNDVVKNIIAKGNGPATTLAAIMAGSGTTAGSAAEAANTNLTIQNNTVMKAQYGIGVVGNATYQTGTVISGNTVGSSTAAEYIGYRGIFISNVDAVSVRNNTISNIIVSSSINVSGIEVTAGVINGSITSNTISTIKSTSTSGYGAYGINFSSATGTTGVLVANNMISGIETANYSTTSTTWNAFGIRIAAVVPNLKIYHNTINLFGAVTSGTSAGMSSAFCTGAAVTGLDVRNNIFRNVQTFGTTGSFAYNMYLTTGTTFTDINYNNYFGTSGTNTTYRLGYSGAAAVLDLAAWKTFTTKDAQSLAVAPNFTSNTDLHLNVGTNTALDNFGTPIAAVTTDFDGETRTATPDMGADEFATSTCATQTLTAGTVTSTVAGFCSSTTGATLSATGYTIGVGATYQWEISTNGTTYTGIATASAIYANLATGALSATTYYRLATICDGGTTVYSNVITITKFTPAVTTVSPAVTICTGGSTTLTAAGSSTYAWSPALGLNGTTGASVTASPSVSTTYTVTGTDANGCATSATVAVTVNPYPSAVTITKGATTVCTNSVMSLTATGGTVTVSGNATSGTGTTLTSSTSYPTAFANYWYKNWQQYLFTKAELNAAGITSAGNISSLKFNISALQDTSVSITDYSVKIASTSNTALSAFTTTGLTNVFGPAAVTPVIGVNTITFSTPYAWDGNSNIIIDIRQSEGYGSANATTYYTATTNNSVIYAYDSGPSSTFYTSSPVATTSTSRPNLVFGYNATAPATMTWSPTTDLYTNAAGTTAYTGGSATMVYTKPSMERTYTATASNGTCTIPATVTVTPEALPVFTVSSNVTICKGQSTTLSTTGTGLTYVWSPALGLNGTTTASVVANPTATTTYTVEATNAAGCKATQTVTVTVSEPGAILTGTTSQIGIIAGSTTFSVTTASGATYTYQWQVNDGSGWADLANDSFYSGVNTATLSLTNIQGNWDGYLYQCLVTGASPCATLTPIVATLTISNTGVETQPANATVCAGNTTSFSIVTNGDEPQGIQWQMSTDNGVSYSNLVEGTDGTTGLTFSGVDTTTLNVSNITFANNGVKFICMLNYYLLSDSATLTVKQPVAASDPSNQTVCASGGTATFSTTATGSDLAYQWQYSTNGGTTWNSYTGTGATTASISLVNPVLGLNGSQYRVLVSGNAACSAVTTAAATLSINNPTITTAPSAATVLRGNTATFTVAASVATSYQWQHSATLNGTYVNVVDDTPTGNTYSGATTASLAVATSATTVAGGGNYYRCVVTNNGCTVTSAGALLTVNWYCTPAPTSVDGTGITNVTMGDINNATGDESGHYGDYTSIGTSATRLSIVNFSVTYATGYTYGTKIWIDYNDNGSFADAGEQVYYGLSTNVNPTTLSGSFSIPLTAPLGAHRMRIGGSDTDLGVDPCYASTFAAFEDYTITITSAPTCAGVPTPGTATAATTSLCSGGAGTTLTLAGYTTGVLGISHQWYYSANGVDFTSVAGQTSTTLATGVLTADAYYYCTVTCSESGMSSTSNTVVISVANPLITGSTPAGRCGTGTVILGATANAGATINWYTAATGGSNLGTGTSFTSPSISATTTYYAEAVSGGGAGNASSTYTGTTNNGASTGSHGIAITTTVPGIKIVSADIPFTGTGTLTIALKDASNSTIYSSVTTSTVTGLGTTSLTIPLNITVPSAGNYLLIVNSVTGTVSGLGYSTLTYPLTALAGAFSVTGGYWYGATASNMYFYNLAVSNGCSSTRTAVVATVDALPTATISYAGSPFCSTATTGAVTRTGTTGGTYSSTAGLTIDGSTGTIDVAASTPGSYVVTYSMNGTTYCTAQTATTTVVINQALTSGFAYDFATYCTNQGTATPTVSGTAGVFTASPAGLSINAVTGAINLASSAAGAYTVTNTVSVAGCANSVSTFGVTVNAAVAITSQPSSVSKLPADNASFSVAATGTGLTYQWEVNTGSGWAAISGETASALSLTAVTAEMNGYQYRVIVSGAATCSSVTSNPATLTVSTAAIATNPVNFTACNEGANTATFTVTTTGSVDTYQWQVSTNGTTWTDITNGGIYADATTTTLALSGLSLSNDGWQFRIVLNGVVYSNPATLTIKTAVAITTPPTSTTGCSAGSASFTVAATGSGLSYQWQVSTNGTTWNNVSGANAATLTLNSLTASMNGYQYQAIVSGASPCSPLTSSAATLTVNTAVAVSVQPANTTVCNAANATFSVTATGTAPTYQWQMSTNGTTYNNISGETASSLTVAAVTLGMNGYKYRVVVTGAAPCGSVTSNAATLTVSQPIAPVVSSATICPASIATLAAEPYANSFDATTNGFAVAGTSASAVVNTTYKTEGTGSIRFNTTATSATATYSMSSNINLSGLSNQKLTFSHQALMEGPTTSYDYGYVEYSADGGATWVTFPTTSYVGSASTAVFTSGANRFTTKSYADWITNFTATTSLPNNTLWKTETFNIPAAALTSQFRIRFRYTTDSSTNYYGWMIDNVSVGSGNTITWSPTTGLYTNAAATTPYVSGHAAVVYAKPSVSTTYTVTTTNGFGCANSSTVNVDLMPVSTLASIAQPSITCSGAQTTFNLTGLLPNSTSTLGYTINSVAQTAITGVVADASGNATFTVALSAVNNGRTLAITSITRTDVTPACATTITANNTVVIAVQPLVTYYADADGDGFGNNAVTQITCQGQPSGYVTNNTDCDDTDNTKHASFPFYADTDGDGYGAGAAVSLCAVNASTPPTAGYATNNTDCNDADATKHASFSFYVDADNDGYGTGSLVSVCAVNSTTPPTGYSLNNTDCNDADGANHANTTTTSNVTACGSYTWSVNGATYSASGTYTSVVNSCHTEVLNLTISCSSVVTVTANIEGYYDTMTHAMRPVLANQGVGSSSTDVDNITVELHDASTYALVTSTTAMLQTNGIAVATFGTAPSGSFYVVVKHRNSLETWSANPVTVGATPASYNFTDAASKAYGNNMKMLETGVYGIYSGDINQDGFIEAQDFPLLFNDSDSAAEGYQTTDLNGDGFVEAQDFPVLFNNADNAIELLRP